LGTYGIEIVATSREVMESGRQRNVPLTEIRWWSIMDAIGSVTVAWESTMYTVIYKITFLHVAFVLRMLLTLVRGPR